MQSGQTRSDLDGHIIALPQDLRAQVPPVEFRQQGLGNIRGRDRPMIDFSLHDIDYNRLHDQIGLYYENETNRISNIDLT